MDELRVNLCEDGETGVAILPSLSAPFRWRALPLLGDPPDKEEHPFVPEKSYGSLPESPLACGPPPFGLPPLACGFPVGRKPIIRQNALI